MKAGTGEIITNEIYNSDSSEDEDENLQYSNKNKDTKIKQIIEENASVIDISEIDKVNLKIM